MSITSNDTRSFLFALVEYAKESQTINPHFYLSEMLNRLSIDEKTFSLLLHRLGTDYCTFVDNHKGEDRYSINLPKCLRLKEQFERSDRETRRHYLLVWLMVLQIILSIVFYILGPWPPRWLLPWLP